MRSECKRLVEAGGGPFILACQGAANRELAKRVSEKYSILIRGPIRIMRGLIPLRCFIVLLKHRFVGSCTFHLCRGDNIGTECKERARDDSFTADRHGRLWTLNLLSSWVGPMHRSCTSYFQYDLTLPAKKEGRCLNWRTFPVGRQSEGIFGVHFPNARVRRSRLRVHEPKV